jgi:DNA ligase-1
MLAASTNGEFLRYPLYASPKLDGVRAIIKDGVVLSRSLKPIPNHFVQRRFGRKALEGCDGELIVGEPTAPDVFRTTTSAVMSEDGEPDAKFYVFDMVRPDRLFEWRYGVYRKACARWKHCVAVNQWSLTNHDDLLTHERRFLREGYEGIMLRSLNGEYKYGRSTLKEAYLVKLKRFLDSEARVLEVLEQETNNNEATTSELGLTKRSSHKVNKTGAGTCGALRVKDTKTGVEFNIGTGMDDEMKAWLWRNRHAVIGRLAKYKYFPGGVKEKPRFPVFIGFRAESDL